MSRTRAAMGALAVVTAVAAAITVTPARHDFGKTTVPNGVALGEFTLSSTPGDSMTYSITGPNAAEFTPDTPQTTACYDANYAPATTCTIDLEFRPKSMGIKTATLVVTNKRGQRATAALRGEGIKADCVAKLVMCNYVNLYSGSIQVNSVDSVATSDHVVRSENDINISVVNGVVTCTGQRLEREVHGYKGRLESEMKGTGPIAGSGMLAIEFEVDDTNSPVYVLTYACPTPKMTKTSTDLASGNSETETFPGALADWRDAERLADPQPSTGIGMTPLKGQHTNTRYEPENKAGGITKSMWELRR